MSGSSGPQAQRGPCPFALLLLLLLGPSSVLAISFHLPVNSRKCLREEIHKDLLVTGAYEITDQSGGAGGLRTHLKVRRGAGRGGRALQALDRGRFWLRLVGVGVEQWSGNAGSSPERCSGKRRVPPSSSQLDFSRDALDRKPPSVLWFSKRKCPCCFS